MKEEISYKELLTKGKEELNRFSLEIREELRMLNFKKENRQLKNVKEIQTLKKRFARILTALRLK